jgi:4-diphosphocytidyl-2-C-methyl-D-erythritol kinase
MLFFPNCKINLGLNITGKRADGYHNLETIFYPVQLNDALEIIPSTIPLDTSSTVFTHSGTIIPGEEKDNLCIKAYHLLKKDFPQIPSIKIHLHKAIPMGAGLGGGSADAAFTLLAINEKYTLNLSVDQLTDYALQLGSDCPFFIINKPCLATGRGEIFQPMNVSLSGYLLVLVNPGIHVNTQWAFSQLNIDYSERPSRKSLQTIISQPVSYWRNELVNDFEIPVFQKYPSIKGIKDALYEKGALFASMSGSGSSVYAIFNNNSNQHFNFPENYLLRTILL